jgi:glycosyltransferase involved in cell wall biosynthesis
VQDGISGYIVDPGDATNLAKRVVDILKDPALAEAMGKAAHAKVFDTFTLKKQATQLKAVYEKILAGVA